MTPTVFVDVETTALHQWRQAWEIAMIRRADGEERTTTFFVEVDLSAADPESLKIGRFYERHPVGVHAAGGVYDGEPAAPRDAAARAVAKWTHGAHIVGLCPWFDTGTLAALMRSEGLTPGWHHHLIDMNAVALGWLRGGPDGNYAERFTPEFPWSSSELSRECGVEPPGEDERHTAYGDALWVLRWWDKLMGAP